MSLGPTTPAADTFAQRVTVHQNHQASSLRRGYDFIVCGAGSSGSVVARRLAENPQAHVLLLEAGGRDDVPAVTEPGLWPTNLGSERDWGFTAESNPLLDGRVMSASMGKVLGGGSSINVMAWARGHRHDWQVFAAESGSSAWGYQAVLDTYRRIEDWHGVPDPEFRGSGGEVFVAPACDPHPLAQAALEGAASLGIATFDHPNGLMMEADRGAAIGDLCIRHGKRVSMFRSYTYPYLDRPNLTVLPHSMVYRITLDGHRATGVVVCRKGRLHHVAAGAEVILCLGAINTPKVLMQSGIGDETELRSVGLSVVHHLPGVGRNYQDHVAVDCVWEHDDLGPPRNNMCEVMLCDTTSLVGHGPDVLIWQVEVPLATPETAAMRSVPASGWSLRSAVARPKSRGRLRLTGPHPHHPIRLDANTFSDRGDFNTALKAVQLCREIGNSPALRPYVTRDMLPARLTDDDLGCFIRNAATTFFHHCGTAKMGRDEMSVVDHKLRVYGIDNLRIADASIMPEITTANTMAPCVVIGERAGEYLRARHGL